MVPPARFWPNLTRTWKFNNYCPILRPSYSNSHSSTFPLCYFPFCQRDPSVFRNAFIDFFFQRCFSCLGIARSHSSIPMSPASQSVWLPIGMGLKFNFELCQWLARGRAGPGRVAIEDLNLKAKPFWNGLIHLENWLTLQQRGKIRIKNQKSI